MRKGIVFLKFQLHMQVQSMPNNLKQSLFQTFPYNLRYDAKALQAK